MSDELLWGAPDPQTRNHRTLPRHLTFPSLLVRRRAHFRFSRFSLCNDQTRKTLPLIVCPVAGYARNQGWS